MRTHTVDIDEAKGQFTDLVAAASEGDEVIIVDNGKALARLIPANDSALYRAHQPTSVEFSGDEEQLAWDSEGWENLA